MNKLLILLSFVLPAAPALAQLQPPSAPPSPPPGLYVQVLDGMITLTNAGGTQGFAAGQFGFTPSFNQPPVIVPNNPGLQFTPPPAFTSNGGKTPAGSSPAKTVDCIVR